MSIVRTVCVVATWVIVRWAFGMGIHVYIVRGYCPEGYSPGVIVVLLKLITQDKIIWFYFWYAVPKVHSSIRLRNIHSDLLFSSNPRYNQGSFKSTDCFISIIFIRNNKFD